jgi:hypothetical protein
MIRRNVLKCNEVGLRHPTGALPAFYRQFSPLTIELNRIPKSVGERSEMNCTTNPVRIPKEYNPSSGAVIVEMRHAQVMLLDMEDSDLAQFIWTLNYSRNTAYAWRRERDMKTRKRLTVIAHRVIVGRMLDRELKSTELVDHIDGNGLNNTRENLRLATSQENCFHSRISKNNKTGYKGVLRNRYGYAVHIHVNGKQKYLGVFPTPELAAQVYNDAASKYFGQFAWLNTIEGGHE